ncbi:MAG: Ig-like domain-containing protein [Planctomycetes bacterium]|nr:Ig-like domain-containing protein [Planctomycetota bacterium]
MSLPRHTLRWPIWLLCMPLVVAGCGGGSGHDGHVHSAPPPPPIAFDSAYAMLAGDRLDSVLDATRIDFATSDFLVELAPAHGLLFVDAFSGDFTYIPDDGFIGGDDFFWDCADAFGVSNVARVTIDVYPWGVALSTSSPSDAGLICRR